MRIFTQSSLALAASALLFTACGSSDTPAMGNVTLQAWGEDYIDVEIPAEDVIDGWTIRFEHALVAISDVTLNGHGDPSLLSHQRVVDLAAPPAGAKTIGTTAVPAGLYNTVQYRVSPVGTGTTVEDTADDAPGVSSAEELMFNSQASIVLTGKATKEEAAIRFNWAFDADTLYERCQIDTTVEKDGESSVELTFHFDHLFNDDLDSPTPNIAFDLIASADADQDGEVTKDELLAVNIEGEERYQVGSRPITNLWDFIAHQSTTVGHINGEGHCGE